LFMRRRGRCNQKGHDKVTAQNSTGEEELYLRG
jgi:hypothetical protein